MTVFELCNFPNRYLAFPGALEQDTKLSPVVAVINKNIDHSLISDATVAKYGITCTPLQDPRRIVASNEYEYIITQEVRLLLFLEGCWTRIHVYVILDDWLGEGVLQVGRVWMREAEAVLNFKAMSMRYKCPHGEDHIVYKDQELLDEYIDKWDSLMNDHAPEPGSDDHVSVTHEPKPHDVCASGANASTAVEHSA